MSKQRKQNRPPDLSWLPSRVQPIEEYLKEDANIQNETLYKLGRDASTATRQRLMSSPSFKNQWYVIAASSQLPRCDNNLLHLQFFCEPLVVYRDPNGKVVVAKDVCPHRSAPLSMGVMSGKGVLQCRYHDWQFGADGRAHNIPHAGKAFIDKVRLFTIPSYEQDDYIWMWYGEPDKADVNGIPSYAFHNELKAQCTQSIGDLDGVWFHHIENLLDHAHTYFIHKERGPFRRNDYSKDAPFTHRQFYDARGFLTVIENSNPSKTNQIVRFDPPFSWFVATPQDGNNASVMLCAHFIPCNKNHTRIIFRGYMKLFATLYKYVPFFDDLQSLENWKILDEDNSLIAGQSIRVDYLRAPVAYRARAEDQDVKTLYEWTGAAISNDEEIWFKSWCHNKGAACVAKGTQRIADNTDIEDLLSKQELISTPWGDLSATAMNKTYPPSNKAMFRRVEAKLRKIKLTLVVLGLLLFLYVLQWYYSPQTCLSTGSAVLTWLQGF
mmetsp:Transcript_43835/g.72407  ORF Transcript_43835/g.72407 Transcript_43835/m.72407 type:complete len:495 (+) Transcript_43835:24-1508(+)